MAMRIVRASALCLRNGARVVDDVLGSSRQRMGIPTHRSLAGKPSAPPTPPPGSFLATIPPSSRAAMRRLAKGGIPCMYKHAEGSTAFFMRDEQRPIGLQGKLADEGAARAAPRTRKREEKNNMSNKHEIAKQRRKDAVAATVKALWKNSLVRKLKDNLWDEKLAAALAWDRVVELEEVAQGDALALQHASDAAETVSATGDDLFARGCELSQDLQDKEWDLQEKEARAAEKARASSKLAQDARKVAEECDGEVKTCAKLLKVAQAAYVVADRVATRLNDEAAAAEDRVAETVQGIQEVRELAPLPVSTPETESGSVSSCDDDQEEPKAKRARR